MSKSTSYVEQEFLLNTVKLLVTKPDDIEITRSEDGMGVLYVLKVNKEDTFRIIGKQSQIINALRLLLKIIGFNNKVRASLKIEPNNK
jgi:predicted RNA-binding protein YlqC (UPF0109 family)